MMRRNFLSVLLFFMILALFQVSLVSSRPKNSKVTAEATEFAGFWQLDSVTANGVMEPIPPGRTIRITMNPEDSTRIRVDIKVANSMMAVLDILAPKNVDGSYDIKVGNLSSTRLRPPPDLVSMERFIVKWFSDLDNMEIEGGSLVFKSPDVTLVCRK